MKKLLIANRGEIACRIIRTCEELHIRTVAVYSEADRTALHVQEADEAVFIGPSEARLSYLDGAKIIDAAKRTHADAIHPGYGFLSENADFAQTVIDAGIIWVGPHPEAMRDMGSKTYARRLATKLGIAVVPGYDGDEQSAKALSNAAKTIGFPIMIKASAGGGGKGIRIVEKAADFAAALKLAKQEAKASFGDDRMIVERYVQEPRHIEVQIMGDKHGNLVHFFTRECSIQRRHQKLIEEAPAPNLPDEIREAMHQAALTLAREIDYDNAGTIEFLYDNAAQEFFFLEMNTRLQVEHPVTEEITGLDLVELQLIAAQGEALRTTGCDGCDPDPNPKLPLTQDMVKTKRVAIESRICAEVPHEDFRPDSGTLADYEEPDSWVADARIDTGVDIGDTVSPYYDSMLAKVIGHGANRDEALSLLIRALQLFKIAGVRNNMEYLLDVLTSEPFSAADLTTHFLEQHFHDWKPKQFDTTLLLMTAAVSHILHSRAKLNETRTSPTPWDTLGTWRVLRHTDVEPGPPIVLELDGERKSVSVISSPKGFLVRVDEDLRLFAADIKNDEALLYTRKIKFSIDDIMYKFGVNIEDDHIVVSQGSDWAKFRIVPRNEQYVSEASQSDAAQNDITAPYPGLITEVLVKPGDAVTAGDHLVVMEAMKMIQHLTAQADGTIKAVYCQPKQSVNSGDLLVEFEKD